MSFDEVNKKFGFSFYKVNRLAKGGKILYTELKKGVYDYDENSIIKHIEDKEKHRKEISRKYYLENKEYINSRNKEYWVTFSLENREKLNEDGRNYYYDNREKCIENSTKYYFKNKEKNKEKTDIYQFEYRLKNKEKRNKSNRDYYYANREELIKDSSEYSKNNKEGRKRRHAERWETDLNYKLSHLLRNRFKSALKNNKKDESVIDLIGCTIDFFKIYIEDMFTEGMSWDNNGKKWHLDHIIPVDAFDLKKIEAQKICFHFSNMQPLWKADNLIKQNKIPIGLLINIDEYTISLLKPKWQKLYYDNKPKQSAA